MSFVTDYTTTNLYVLDQMNVFIRYGFSAELIPLYNCSLFGKKYGKEYSGTVHNAIGFCSLIYGIATEVLYLLVMSVMIRKDIIKWSCYKIMFFLGIYDMIDIAINSIITGIFFLNGIVYCDYPDVIYIIGTMGVGIWCGACLACLLLVFNRVMALWKPAVNKQLFEGRRTVFWLIAPFIYSLYFLFFTPPVLFNSYMMAWLFDPFIRVNDYGKFWNTPDSVNNVLVVATTCTLYIFLSITINKELRHGSSLKNVTKKEKSIIIQSFFICSANLAAALIYAYMQFFPTPMILIFIGHLAWMMAHSIPVYIYLTLNKTIQKDVLSMFGLEIRIAKSNSQVAPATSGAMG